MSTPLSLPPSRSFGNIKAVRLGPAPATAYPGQQAAEVYFSTVGQAAAALTALNAIVVPALSGGQQLEVRCWGQQPRAAAAAAHTHSGRGQAAAAAPERPFRPQQAQQAQRDSAAHQAPVGAGAPPEPAAAVELPGIKDLPAALDFCSSCCFKAVPGELPNCRPGPPPPACAASRGSSAVRPLWQGGG